MLMILIGLVLFCCKKLRLCSTSPVLEKLDHQQQKIFELIHVSIILMTLVLLVISTGHLFSNQTQITRTLKNDVTSTVDNMTQVYDNYIKHTESELNLKKKQLNSILKNLDSKGERVVNTIDNHFEKYVNERIVSPVESNFLRIEREKFDLQQMLVWSYVNATKTYYDITKLKANLSELFEGLKTDLESCNNKVLLDKKGKCKIGSSGACTCVDVYNIARAALVYLDEDPLQTDQFKFTDTRNGSYTKKLNEFDFSKNVEPLKENENLVSWLHGYTKDWKTKLNKQTEKIDKSLKFDKFTELVKKYKYFYDNQIAKTVEEYTKSDNLNKYANYFRHGTYVIVSCSILMIILTSFGVAAGCCLPAKLDRRILLKVGVISSWVLSAILMLFVLIFFGFAGVSSSTCTEMKIDTYFLIDMIGSTHKEEKIILEHAQNKELKVSDFLKNCEDGSSLYEIFHMGKYQPYQDLFDIETEVDVFSRNTNAPNGEVSFSGSGFPTGLIKEIEDYKVYVVENIRELVSIVDEIKISELKAEPNSYKQEYNKLKNSFMIPIAAKTSTDYARVFNLVNFLKT